VAVSDELTVTPELNVCAADQVWIRFNSAMVPVLAGRLAVTVPRAPVTGCKVSTPDVALPIATEPAVPETPRDKAPLVSDVTVSVVHPPEPFDVRRLPAEPPVVQPDPPLAAAHVGLALAPCVSKKNPLVPGASTVQIVEFR
jgi:hypothetical protein